MEQTEFVVLQEDAAMGDSDWYSSFGGRAVSEEEDISSGDGASGGESEETDEREELWSASASDRAPTSSSSGRSGDPSPEDRSERESPISPCTWKKR